MSTSVTMIICFLSFIVSIIISYRRKLNTGILSMAFAYLIGCFIMNMSVHDIIALFPVRMMFLLFSVCFFYGYAIQNGTLQVVADNIIYCCRNKTRLLPFILYVLAFFLAVLGASAPAISSFLAPVCIMIGNSMGIHYLIMLVLICIGSSAGSLVPWGQGGLILRGIIENTVYVEQASAISLKICLNLFITGLLALSIVYVLFKGYRSASCEVRKPESFNNIQKKTLLILGIVLAFVLIPSIINTIFEAASIQRFLKLFDIQMLSILGACILALLNLGDEKKVLTQAVPWNTIILVCGVCMLLGVIAKTGVFNTITKLVEFNLPMAVIGCLFILIAGFMSFFSGALSVVIPLLLPMALSISTAAGYNPICLASAVVIGATMTCISPFSSAGSFILSCIPDEKIRDEMFGKQFLLSILLFAVPVVLMIFGVYQIL